ncbi:MAG TPA: polymer-forming cytoskeletal protein [Thermoanaerobaculia bacterium]|nr:polymer-forming cytoskeletal protein [Thermoanaerobaculia bacterium]
MRRFAPITAVALALLVPAAPAAAQSEVDDAQVVVSGDVVVERGEAVEGVFIVSGDARVSGRVDGDVVLVSGDAVVNGRIDGNLVTVAGQARLLPRASVGGDVIYADEAPRVAPAAVVEGEIEEEDWFDSLDVFSVVGAFALWFAVSISSVVLGIGLLLLGPRAADAAFAQAQTRFWTAVGLGAGAFVGLPLLAFVSAVTLVGLPLAIGIGLALLPLGAVAYVTAAWALGRLILKPPRERILSFLIGLAILRLAALLPVLGLVVWLAAVIVGLGLLAAAITAARRPPVAQTQGI